MKDLEYLQRQSEKELSILAKGSDANHPFWTTFFISNYLHFSKIRE